MKQILPFKPRPVQLPGDIVAMARKYLTHRAVQVEPNTVLADRSDLEQFVGYLRQLDISYVQVVSAENIENFGDALIKGGGNKKRTAARKLSSVKSFFKWLVKHDIITLQANPFNKVEPIRFHSEPPIAPSIKAIQKVIDSIGAGSKKMAAGDIRDRAMFQLMLEAALRESSLVSIDLYDEEHPNATMVKPSGMVMYLNKGGAIKDSVCGEKALERIDQWLKVRHRFAKNDGNQALFLSRTGTRLSRVTVWQRLKKHAKAAGLPDLHPHLLRHARVNEVIAHPKGGLHAANYLTGHKLMSTTMDLYGHSQREQLRLGIQRNVPLGVSDAGVA